jgi:transcriptional regulator with XRE-family HTH domain
MIQQELEDSLRPQLKKFLNKDYRDDYLKTNVRTGIALQVRALREKAGLSQKEFAALTGKKQGSISRLENINGCTVNTLLAIASGTGVALVVRFVDYPEFLRSATDMSPQKLAPDNVRESLVRLGVEST